MTMHPRCTDQPLTDHLPLGRPARTAVVSAALSAVPLLSSYGGEGGTRLSATGELGGWGGPPTADQLPEFFTGLMPEISSRLGAVDALVPPEGPAGDVDRVIDTPERSYTAMVKAVGTDPQGSAEDASDPFEATDAVAAELGLTACADS